MSAPRAAAQLFRMPVALGLFVPPANTRAGTAQRAIPTIALNTYQVANLRACVSGRISACGPSVWSPWPRRLAVGETAGCLRYEDRRRAL